MSSLLVVHHTTSPSLHTMVTAVVDGTGADGLGPVSTMSRAALSATASDVLAADGIVIVTPANLGSMAGAVKHFFDTVYYPVLEEAQGRPWGLAVHGNDDVTGAVGDIERIVRGLGWRQVTDHVLVLGTPDATARDACWNLGATVASLP